MILNNSVFFGMVDLHDQHRDMRLDVDHMTYEVSKKHILFHLFIIQSFGSNNYLYWHFSSLYYTTAHVRQVLICDVCGVVLLRTFELYLYHQL